MKKVKLLCSLFAALLFSSSMWAANVAKIGSTEYATLADAIEAVQDGQTITIISDVDATGWVEINKPAVAFTIDLNGKKIERTDGSIFDIYSKVTFKDSQTGGTIKAKGRALYGNEGADFTLESGNIIGTEGNVINVIGAYGSAKKPAKFTMNGGAVTGADGVNLQGETYGAEFVMNGGTITSEKAGLAWHGNNTEDAVKITINAGTIIGAGEGALNGNGSKSGAKVTIVDGTFTCDGGSAMYMPYQGNTTISGGTFTGAEALVIKGGNVSISGGTFIANGAAIDPTSAGESAYAQTGDAIYVEDNYGVSDYSFFHNITLNITGGVFTSTNANAISARFSNAHASKVPAQITISGGQFKSATNKAVIHSSNGFAGSIVASAGVYNLAPAQDYIVTGKMAVANTDEATKVAYPWMIGLPSNVAKIGTTEYATLEAAIAAVQDGQTITLIADVNTQAVVEIEGKIFVLDLNGKKIEYTGATAISTGVLRVHNGASLTINDSSNPSTGKIVSGSNAYAAVAMTKAGDDKTKVATLIINAGTLEGTYYAITGNGSRPNTAITINGGTLTANYANDNIGIYHPQDGVLTINGGTITAYSSAIELRAGTLVITDGTLTATSETFSCNAGASNSTTVGAAIAIAQHTTKVDMNVTISGGSFSGVKALNESNPQENDPAPQVTMAISGGKFAGEIATADVQKFISGGIYSADPADAYVAAGYKKTNNVDEATKVAYPHTVIKEGEVSDGTSKSYVAAQLDVINTLADWKKATPETLKIVRKIYKDGYYNTLCLPFALTNEQIVATFGAYKELKKFISAEVQGEGADREIVLNLEDATSIEAGKAYLITFENGTTLTELVFTGVTVTKDTAVNEEGDLVYQGILAPYQMPYEDENYLFVGEQNKLYWAIDDGTFMKGFRAYFKVDDSPKSPYRFGMKAIFGEGKNTPTDKANVNASAKEIKKLIEQGRVVIMNNGVKYDMSGKVVK